MKFSHVVLATLTFCATGAFSSLIFAQKSEAKAVSATPLKVAFVLYDNMEVLDLSGPMDVFVKAERTAPSSYSIYTVGINGKPIHSESGVLNIQPRYSIANCPRPDILVMPGAPMPVVQALSANGRFMQWIKKASGESRMTMSICTGAFVLGKAGLLAGRKATTHWFALEEFQQEFPRTTVMQGVRFVEDGKFITTSGVSSGIDGALHVVEKIQSSAVAEDVARIIQYRPHAPVYPTQTARKFNAGRAPKKAAKTGSKLSSRTDPICGMKVTDSAKFTSEYRGRRYGFCAQHCQKVFEAHPARYVK